MSRDEHASLNLRSDVHFVERSEVFGGKAVAAEMIDRIINRAGVRTLTGSS
jgi:hypothetical protein